MTFKTTTLIAFVLLLTLGGAAATADCRQDQKELGPGDWLVVQKSKWPATIHATDDFNRGLQLVVRGLVCNADREPIPGAGLQLVQYEKLEGAERPHPTFADLSAAGGKNFKVVDRVTADSDDSGNVRATVKPGHYALLAVDADGNQISGRLVFDIRIIQGFATALAYGEITSSE